MANVNPFRKTDPDPSSPFYLAVKCATAITNTRLAYKQLTTDHEMVELCGDDDYIDGFPDKQTSLVTEAFNLCMPELGFLEGIASGAITARDYVTAAALGKLRTAVPGVDKCQLIAVSTAADGGRVTVKPARGR